jgi:hypothetical protein
MFREEFPRKPGADELELIYRILPEHKPGYRIYRDLISTYYLIGRGSSGISFIFSRNKDEEYIPFVTSVFAAGTFKYNQYLVDLVINEKVDETIEIEIDIKESIPADFREVIYSGWVPGNEAPGDNSRVKEINIIENKFVLAIVPGHKKIWLYEYESGVVHFIPSGAYYNNLCILKNIRDPELVFNPKLLFENLANYSDNELISAFYLYNKNQNRFRIEMPVKKEPEKKTGFLRMFLKKDKN